MDNSPVLGKELLAHYTVRDVLGVSHPPLTTVDWNSPVALASLHLSSLDVEAVLVLDEQAKVSGVLAGYNVLTLLETHPEDAWSALYKTRSFELKWRILSATPGEPLSELVSRMANRRFGYSAVTEDEKPIALIGVIDLAKFYASLDILKHNLRGVHQQFPNS